MEQTPIHDTHNADLLALIPPTAQRLIEIGCSSGVMAREFKKINPGCDFTGVEIVPAYAEQAKRYCDRAFVLNIDQAPDYFFELNADRDCWIFADVLEHLYDPWATLKKIRAVLPPSGCVVACIPNAQNWLVQTRLCTGNFKYEDAGLMDRTHIRWFTRQTMQELFIESGFRVDQIFGRVFDFGQQYSTAQQKILPLLGQIGQTLGHPAPDAMQDAIPFQYVLKASV